MSSNCAENVFRNLSCSPAMVKKQAHRCSVCDFSRRGNELTAMWVSPKLGTFRSRKDPKRNCRKLHGRAHERTHQEGVTALQDAGRLQKRTGVGNCTAPVEENSDKGAAKLKSAGRFSGESY